MTSPISIESVRPGQDLAPAALERLLKGCAPAGGETPEMPASSLYLEPGRAQQFLESSHQQAPLWRRVFSHLAPALLKSDTGVIGLRTGQRALVVLPPFPVREEMVSEGWDTGPLLDLLATEYTVGVVLLRLGRYSVAVYRGDRLVSSKTDSRYVKGRHHAGGTSQLRFQRIREGQMRQIYEETCRIAQARFGPYAGDLDYVLLGGENSTLNGFLKACPYMRQFRDITLGRRLNIRDPKRDTLEGVAVMLKESRVYPVNLDSD